MGLRIESGKGHGYEAGVTSEHRLLTDSVSVQRGLVQAYGGRGFFIGTGLISLTTTASYSALLYVLNGHSTDHLHFGAVSLGTDGEQAVFQVLRNPTGGSILNIVGDDVDPPNANFASGASFIGTVRKGADGGTLTGGETLMYRQMGESGIDDALRYVIIPPQSAIGFLAKPAAACDVNIELFAFYHNGES